MKYSKAPPRQLGLTIDGDNLSAITEVSEDIKSLEFINYLLAAVIFESKPDPENILIIEPGGGLDILESLYFSPSSNISVIQNNGLMVDLLKNEKKVYQFNGNIYSNPNVQIYSSPEK